MTLNESTPRLDNKINGNNILKQLILLSDILSYTSSNPVKINPQGII